jgi:fimbrial chaperone protein
MKGLSRLVRWLVFAGALFAAGVQAVTVSPVRIELSPTRRVATVTITNSSDQPISFQTETLAWSQQNGTDRYEPTDELLVAPPIAEIPPQSSQIFRVALRGPLAETGERAYRLILEDVSEILAPQPGTVAIRFNHNLPVFAVSANDVAKVDPRWSRCAASPGKGCVRLDNGGSRHLRLSELTVTGPDWRQTVQGGTVLAGGWKQWLFDLPPGGSLPAGITALTDLGALSAELSATLP